MAGQPHRGGGAPEFEGREVSCGVLTGLMLAAERDGCWTALFDECGYSPDHLRDPTARISWSALQLIARRAGEHFSSVELRQIGASALRTDHFEPQLLLARLLLKPTEAYSFVIRGDTVGDFACVGARTTVTDQRVRIEARIGPGYGHAPELFEIMAGAAAEVPVLFGLKPADVHLTLLPDGADFDVLVPPGGGRWSLLRRLRRSSRITAVRTQLNRRTESFETQISKRLTAEAHLRASVLEHDRRMANIRDVIMEIDGTGDVCFVSPNCEDRIGVSATDLASDPWSVLGKPDDGGAAWSTVVKSSTGERRLEINPSTYEDESGEGLLLLIRDVTERFDLAEALSKSRRFESLGVMASGVAHDFNNLLVPILANSSALLDELPSSSPVRERVESIATAARLGSDLAEQILATTGQSMPEPSVCDAAAAARSLRRVLEAFCDPNIELVVDVCESGWASIDEASFTQLATNLVLNATQAVGETDGWVRLTIDLADDDRVQLVVEDNGRGMSAEEQERMTEPFFTTRQRGRGLGLASLAGLLQAGKAELSVDSTEGVGSRIAVTFAAVEAGIAPGQERAQREDGVERDFQKVLVVEDDPLVRRTLEEVLRGPFADVIATDSPHEALMHASSGHSFDCVVVDFGLSGMRGPDLIWSLRRVQPDLPACLVTGTGVRRASEALALAEVEGVEIVAKPFRPSVLLDAVGRAVDARADVSS